LFSIGQIKIEVLLITPLDGVNQKFFVSASKYWRQGRRPVNVGHRGLGKTNTEHIPSKHQSNSSTDSNKQRTNDSSSSRPVQTKFVSENTLASFKGAFQLGFDFVEFDVQLSKDKVPVVYHDFQVAITLKRKGHQAELFVVPVKDLTLPQLQSLKIYHASETDVSKVDEELDDDDQTNLNNNNISSPSTTFTPTTNGEHDQQAGQQDEKKFRSLFPTLQELFEKLDPHLGFNVEIKYAMEYRQGGSEQNHYFERNEYIDCILRCLITHGKFLKKFSF
jgi:glycerophosphocholine phosphodiesterase GPCPD1